MLLTYEAIYERLEIMHQQIAQAIAGLTPEALDWTPGPDVPSLAVLVTHTCGAERYWIGDVAGGDISHRDRDAEFRAADLNTAMLLAHLDEVLAHSKGVLEALTLDDLEAVRVSPRDGRQYTTAWALAHALEHTGIHLGHVQIIRQWWDRR